MSEIGRLLGVMITGVIAQTAPTMVVVFSDRRSPDNRSTQWSLTSDGPATVWEFRDVPDSFREIAPRALIIMGVSGSGKSTLGVELASALACPFLDGDAFHSADAIAKMRSGQPLTDEDRWPWLDILGQAIDAEVANHGVVVAACSALRKVYRDRLRQTIQAPICFVLLDGERQELLRRLSTRSGHYMPPSLLNSQLETLERPTSDEAVITLDAGQTPAVLRDQIFAQLVSAAAPK